MSGVTTTTANASTTSTWDITAQEIIYGALRVLGAIESGEIPPANEYQDALNALNGLIKQWQGSGIHLWAEADGTLFLEPGQVAYNLGPSSTDHAVLTANSPITTLTATALSGATSLTLASATGIAAGSQIGIWIDAGSMFWTAAAAAPNGGVVTITTPMPSQATSGALVVSYQTALSRPLRVPSARLVFLYGPPSSIIEVPMMPMSRIYYAQVPDKFTPGEPTQYFFDPQIPNSVMNVWPAPPSALGGICVRFTGQFQLTDVQNGTQITGFPQEWIAALRFNLAKELALEYSISAARFQEVTMMANEKFAMASAWDREPESIRFSFGTFPTQRN